MSGKVPLLASEKIKLAFWIFVAVIILVPAVIGGWKLLYKQIIRDYDGYNKKIAQVAEYYHFEIISYNEDLNRYKLSVDPDTWKGMSSDYRTRYCNMCYEDICKTQWKYKITDEGEEPYMYFFVNNRQVGHIAFDTTTVYN